MVVSGIDGSGQKPRGSCGASWVATVVALLCAWAVGRWMDWALAGPVFTAVLNVFADADRAGRQPKGGDDGQVAGDPGIA